eukprot:TRINITY_DN31420_c0_g1_i1.p1 TRINITY_DN31420_c0_g1~~TRINITY_DN31420_c0_g1_i1.p1  ORF type:complete len:482 (+),score=95.76 TRINITY_DN31420_c0_g1_i1:43-1488(+)
MADKASWMLPVWLKIVLVLVCSATLLPFLRSDSDAEETELGIVETLTLQTVGFLSNMLGFRNADQMKAPELADSRPVGATAAAWKPAELQVKDFLTSIGVTGTIEAATFSGWFNKLQSFMFPISKAQYQHAQRFYEQERPLILESAKRFQVHGYWSKHMSIESLNVPWMQLLALRMKSLRLQMEQEGRHDSKVERDKCDMLDWLQRNGFPIPQVVGVWRNSPEEFTRDLLQQLVPSNETSWPMFAKICHLTQGIEDSVRRLRSPEWVLEHREELESFVKLKWYKTTNDADRVFAQDSNALSRKLQPGMVLQESYSTPAEFKVQVLWGRAYLAYFIEGEGIVCRDGTFEQGSRSKPWGLAAPVPVRDSDWAWLEAEGHLPRIWQLAEAVALSAGCEQMRVDIFVRKGEPTAVAVNEISLSSGASMHMHSEFIGKLWSEPYIEQTYQSYPSRTPIHKLDVNSGDIPNLEAMQQALKASRAMHP